MYCVNSVMQALKYLFHGTAWMKKSTMKFVWKNYQFFGIKELLKGLNPDQQTVLDWLKTNVKQDNVSPMCAVFLLGEWQTRIGLKELGSVDISYCRLNPKQQAQVLQVFGEWCNEREEANESNS